MINQKLDSGGDLLADYDDLPFRMKFNVWNLFWPSEPKNCAEEIQKFVRVFFNRIKSSIKRDLDSQCSPEFASCYVERNTREEVLMFSNARPAVFIKYLLSEQKIIFTSKCCDTCGAVFATVINIISNYLLLLADEIINGIKEQEVLFGDIPPEPPVSINCIPEEPAVLTKWPNKTLTFWCEAKQN